MDRLTSCKFWIKTRYMSGVYSYPGGDLVKHEERKREELKEKM